MPRRAHDRRRKPLQYLATRVNALTGGPWRAHHELAESAGDGRPILLIAAAPGRCTRCDAIRRRQRQYDLAVVQSVGGDTVASGGARGGWRR